MPKPPRKPRTSAVIAAVLLLVATISLISTLSALIQGKAHAPQFSAPGSFTSEIKEPGRYYLWNHYKTYFDGKSVKRPKKFPNDLRVLIQDSEGTEIPLNLDNGQSWSIGNHGKISIGYIESPGDQSIQISITGSAKKNPILSFAPADMGNDLWIAFRGLLVTLIGVVLGLPLLVWVLFFSRS